MNTLYFFLNQKTCEMHKMLDGVINRWKKSNILRNSDTAASENDYHSYSCLWFQTWWENVLVVSALSAHPVNLSATVRWKERW